MSSTDPPAYQPEKPRFTVRGLMIATAIVAVYAAIGGAVCRHLNPGDEALLLVFWCATGLAIPLAWYSTLWWEAKIYGSVENLRYVVPVLGPGPNRKITLAKSHSPARRQWWWALGAVGFYLGWWSFLVLDIGREVRDKQWGLDLAMSLITAPIGAFVVAHYVVALLIRRDRRIVALSDAGLHYYALKIPWKHLHEVRWLADDPGTLFLHRYDGDIYLRPAADQRDAVEAFIRERTGLPCEPAPAPKEPA